MSVFRTLRTPCPRCNEYHAPVTPQQRGHASPVPASVAPPPRRPSPPPSVATAPPPSGDTVPPPSLSALADAIKARALTVSTRLRETRIAVLSSRLLEVLSRHSAIGTAPPDTRTPEQRTPTAAPPSLADAITKRST